MTLRLTAIVIAVLDLFGLSLAAFNLLIADGDPATRGLDQLGGYSIALLFLLTGLPALVLAGVNRAPRVSLGLALAFPAMFLVLLVGAVLLLP
ncbi:MAG TPA: hypothetical protein VE224_20640, partial [Pseudolabrys sp.]|nr:hypothetical protein [Pseudolabrys sp.]